MLFKFSPPKLSDTVPRTRLEALLDQAIDRTIVSVCAPAGTGKSTAIASYVTSRWDKYLWLNLDDGDSDPANFFGVFSQGAKAAFNLTKPFPFFSPEFLQALSVYSSNFFRHLFNEIKGEFAIVLDNLHKIRDESPTHEIIMSVMKELPDYAKFFIISRSPLPFASTEWAVEKKFLRLQWPHLRFDLEEIKILLENKAVPRLTADELDLLISSSKGVVANILLEIRKHRIEKPNDNLGPVSGTSLTSEFSSLESKEIDALMRLAELTDVTEESILALCDSLEPLEILRRYATEGFFVVPVASNRIVYRIHDLFREFLANEAKTRMDEKDYLSHMTKVASILMQQGKEVEAVRVLDKIGAYSDIYKIILEKGIKWLSEGRLFLLEETINFLANSNFFHDPWIEYFKSCLIRFNQPKDAISLMQSALRGFSARGDETGKKMALGELLDLAQYLGEDFSYVGPLLDEADSILRDLNDDSISETDAFLAAHAGIMHLLHRSDPIRSIDCFKKALYILKKTGSKMPLFQTYLLVYTAISCDTAGLCKEADSYFKEAEHLFDSCPEHPPHTFMFNFLASIHEVFSGRFENSVKRIEKTLAYSRRWGLIMQEEHLHIRELEGLLCQGDSKKAKRILKVISGLPYRNSFSMAMTYQLEAQMNLIDGNYHEAAVAADKSASIFNSIKAFVFEDSSRSLNALAIAHGNESEAAISILDAIINKALKKHHIMQVFSSTLQKAYVLFMSGKISEALNSLAFGLKLGRKHGFKAIYNWYPALMSELLSIAIENDIEQEYAKSLIVFHKLKPPKSILTDSGWPWHLRIYTFGEFKVFREDEEIPAEQWKGSRSLELFRALLACGTEIISLEVLGDYLWPDLDGDKALQNIEFTLRRLRKSLSGSSPFRKKILPVKGGMLKLNRDLCWADVYAFKEYVYLSELSETSGDENKANKYRKKAIEVYKGLFLSGFNEPFVITAREKWHQKFLRVADLLTRYLAKKGKWDDVIPLCRRVLSFEPTSSHFTHLLMKGLVARGEIDEAISAYKRLENMYFEMGEKGLPKTMVSFFQSIASQ